MTRPHIFPQLSELQRETTRSLPPDLQPLTAPVVASTSPPNARPAVFPEYRPPTPPAEAINLEAVQQEAEAIRRNAIQEAEQIRQRAHQEGYQQGYEQGYAEAKQRAEQETQQALFATLQRLQNEVQAFLESLREQSQTYLHETEQGILQLALEAVRKVVKEELRLHPDHALQIVRETLKRVRTFGEVRIRVNPLDLSQVRQHRTELLAVLDGVPQIEIVEDRRVEQGTCVIETDHGTYDARLSTQLAEIERALRDSA
ncbi:MAG: FliH/SctL family protein [Fimbriimonadales bacterium]